MTELKEIRCHKCGKLLAKGEILVIELKCPRCKAYNILRATSARPEPREGRTETESDAR
nr:Com family DNA-binding transcriptional regulator [Bilophila wadsworthia]